MPIILSDLFTETRGQEVVAESIGRPALGLLGVAGMFANILLSETLNWPSSVSSVTLGQDVGQIIVLSNAYAYVTVGLFLISAIVCAIAAAGAYSRRNVKFNIAQIIAMSANSQIVGRTSLRTAFAGHGHGRDPYRGHLYTTIAVQGNNHRAMFATTHPGPEDFDAKMTTLVL